MRKPAVFFSLFLLGVIVLSGCNLGMAPTVTQAPVEPSQPPPVTEAPTLTEVPIEPTVPPTIIPVDLSGPPMEIGSKFAYVDGSVLVAVPGGQFTMGHGGFDDPEHLVNVSDFWIYRAKVTNTQYAFCVKTGQCSPPDLKDNTAYGDPLQANNPVVGVTYDQAAAYCTFVHGRLPTEAEWEKTARGPDGNIYPWGDTTPTCDLLNAANCVRKTTPVVDYPQGQSYYEALDMAGNAYEWVADWYSQTYYGKSPADNPLGPDTGKKRSVRSNAFDSPAYEAESARRFSARPDDHKSDIGFRCVVMDPTYFAPMCQATLVYGENAGGGSVGSGGLPSESCPKIGITQNSYCQGKLPVTNVVFSGTLDAKLDANGCAPTADPALFVCQSPGTVSIKADCKQTLPGDPACPAGYTQDGNTCVAQGKPGECLPGFNYDPANQCCTAQPGVNDSIPLPICPLGTYYVAGKEACVPYPAKGIVSVVQTLNFADCNPRTGGGCQLDANICRQNYSLSFCASTCTCFDPAKYTCP